MFLIIIVITFSLTACSRDECSNFENVYEINECRMKNAISTDNISACENDMIREDLEIVNPINQCYIGFAVKNRDYSICSDNIADIEYKAYCLASIANVKNDVTNCNQQNISESERNKCYTFFATEKKEDSACLLIEDETEYDFCLFSVATELNDESLCKKVNNVEKREKCLKAVEIVKNK